MSEYDTIVVGIGGMGSAALYQLACVRKQKVLGLEQFNVGHDQGSSHGVSRIIRLPYYEHPNYVPLLKRAFELWKELENAHRHEHNICRKLLFQCGSIDAGPEDGRVFQGALASCYQHKLMHRVLTAKKLNEMFPGYQLPDHFRAIYQADGGYLLSEKCIDTYVQLAKQSGHTKVKKDKLNQWESDGKTVVVKTESGNTYRAKSLVLTVGAWASIYVNALSMLARVMPERQVIGWFQPLKPEHFRDSTFPVFNLQGNDKAGDRESRYYGFPMHTVDNEDGSAEYGFKIGRYHHLEETNQDPEQLRRAPDSKDEALLRQAIQDFFPLANGPLQEQKACLFSNSTDDDFIIDNVPGYENVAFAAGFSGHGFKFCSVVGEVLAELVCPDHNSTTSSRKHAKFLGLKRFQQRLENSVSH